METLETLTRIKTYSEYKATGVKWLHEIPSHWSLKKGKWLFLKQERAPKKEDEIVTCFRDGEVTLRSNRKTEGFTNALKEHGYQGIRKGDLVIHAMDAFAGAIGVSDSDGKSTPVYAACVPRAGNSVDVYYYAYFLRNLARTGFIESLAKGIRERSTDFRFNDFGILVLPVPPKPEQTLIARFLDRKTAQIDKAIAQKEKLIELLKERRQILIHNAVTKGLNPNVRMKDSGVEWIGEIPEHWEVRRLSTMGTFSKGGGISRNELSIEGFPAILYGDIYTKYDTYVEDVFHKVSSETGKKSVSVDYGTILFTGSGETIEDIGKCVTYLNDEPCFAGGDIIIFKPRRANQLYLSFVLNSHGLNNEKSKLSKGEIIVHIYASKLKSLSIPVAPVSEQQEIAQFLLKQKQYTETTIRCKSIEIEKLKEFKATLINSAVTGKIKVPDIETMD